jgi:hypothetical protein
VVDEKTSLSRNFPKFPEIILSYFAKLFFYFAKFFIAKSYEISQNFCGVIKFLAGRDILLNFLAFQCHQKENFYVKNTANFWTDPDPFFRERI